MVRAICSTMTGARPSDGSSSNSRRPSRRVRTRRLAADLEIFSYRQVSENPPVLRHVSQAQLRDLMRLSAVDARAVEDDPARPRAHQGHDRFQRRGFARTVAAEQDHDLARRDLKRQIGQDMRAAVEGIDVAQRQHHGALPNIEPAPR
jgi:hypothetical protein